MRILWTNLRHPKIKKIFEIPMMISAKKIVYLPGSSVCSCVCVFFCVTDK